MAISKLNPIEGGIPKGNTSNRSTEFPSPEVGDVYYNGEIEALEIYNGTVWKVSKTEGFPPDAPTISSVTDSSTSLAYSSTAGTLDVVFVPASTGGTVTQYNAYTTTGGHSSFTTVGNTVTITGLTPGTAYTVYGNAQNGSGTSTNTENAAAVTPTTLPQSPTIGTTVLSSGLAVVNWTLGSTGGKNISAITITPYLNGATAETSRTAATTSSTSYTFTSGQLSENASYTFKVKTTNANGQSAESSASNSITTPFGVQYLVVAGGGAGGGAAGGGGGGYRTNVGGNTFPVSPSTNYSITIGSGGTGQTSNANGNNGTNSSFSTISSTGGGGGGSQSSGFVSGIGGKGGGGGGGHYGSSTNAASGDIGNALNNGGNGTHGVGVSDGGSGGANTGGGGGGMGITVRTGGNGGSGIVVLKWLTSAGTISIGAGLTADSTVTSGSYSIKKITSGSGNVSWS